MTQNKASERRSKAQRLLAKRREKIRWELDKPIRRKNSGRRVVDKSHILASKSGSGFLSNFADLWILTSSGQLGCFNKQRQFVVNTRLTEALRNYTLKFLKAYQNDPDGGHRRIAIIRLTEQARAWGTETLIMEEFVVRQLYSVSGQTSAELTSFQKRNQENSIYRGMELLLERQDEAMPGLPIFCPVLYDRGLTLADCPSITKKNARDSDNNKTPIIEVLNLITAIPISERNSPEIRELLRSEHYQIVKKDLRKTPKFELVDDVKTRPRSMNTFPPGGTKKTGKRK